MGLFSCAKPDVPSKKEIIVSLGRERETLQTEVSRAVAKLASAEKEKAALFSEKAAWSGLRQEYEESLQAKTTATAQLLVKCVRLASVIDTGSGKDTVQRRGELNVDVIAYDPDGVEVLMGDEDAVAGGGVRRAKPSGSEEDEGMGVRDARPEARLEAAFNKLENESMGMLQRLNAVHADMDALRAAKLASEEKAAGQQQTLELRCSALEQENRGLNELNEDLQVQLDRLNQDLSSFQASSQGSTSKLMSELQMKAQQAGNLSAELQATVLMVAALQADVADRDRQMADLRAAHEAHASEVEALQASLLVRETELTSVAADKSTEAAAAAESQRSLSSVQAELAQLRREAEGVRGALAAREAELLALTEAHTAAELELSGSRQELGQLRRQAGDLEARVPLLEERAKRGEARASATEAELQASRATLTEIQRTAGARAIELASTLAQLEASRRAVVDAEDSLAAAMIASEASDRALQDMTNQYVSTRRDLIASSKQMAALAADHSRAMGVLSTTQDDLSAVQRELDIAREDALQLSGDIVTAHQRLEGMNATWPLMQAELGALKVKHAEVVKELEGRRSLLEAIARLSVKGNRTPHKQSEASLLAYYQAALNGDVVKLKVCDTPLGLCGSLLTSLAESKDCTSLVLDMDCSREPLWEKAGLRAACLAAALSLNTSVRTLEINGWTWDELGNGMAMPFLTLGSCSGLTGLSKVRMDTKLFDVESASALLDLLRRGLIDLNRPGGQGVLRLVSDNENLDEWYGIMMRDAVTPAQRQQQVVAAAHAAVVSAGDGSNMTPRSIWGAPPSPTPTHQYAGYTASLGSGSEMVVSGSTPSMGARSSASGHNSMSDAAPYTPSFVDTDMSNEALESHHMVIVMAVLVCCPHLKRLRLDGNKIGNSGAELLSMGLAHNSSLRELSLARNSILAIGAKRLAKALEANTSVVRLDLSGQRFEGLGPAGAEAIAGVLRKNRTLEELQLASNSIGGAGAKALCDVLREVGPGSLKRLAVALNGLDSGSARALQAVAAEMGVAISV